MKKISKILLTVLMFLVLIGIKNVNAETLEEYAAKIPDTLEIEDAFNQYLEENSYALKDITVYDYNLVVEQYLASIINNENISISARYAFNSQVPEFKNEEEEGDWWANKYYEDYYNLSKMVIELEDENNNIQKKEVAIKYAATENDTDREFVQKLMAKKNFNRYRAFTSEEFEKELNYQEFMENDIKKLISADNVTVVICNDAQGGSFFNSYFYNGYVMVYIGNVLYGVHSYSYSIYDYIIVPDEVADTFNDYIEYAKPLLYDYYKELFTDLDYGCEEYGNCYNIKSANDLIIKKTEGDSLFTVYVNDIDLLTLRISKKDSIIISDGLTMRNEDVNKGIVISATTIAENSNDYQDLKTALANKGLNNVFGTYEMTLNGGDISEGVDLTFTLGNENNGKTVIILHKKQDGTIEEFEKVVENGRVTITVNELSPFMIALKETSTTPTDTANTPSSSTSSDQSNTTDNQNQNNIDNVQTGDDILNCVGLLGISLGGLIGLLIKKRRKVA